MKHLANGLLFLIATFVPAASLVAEVFVLANGGQVVGQWVNRDESPREKYVIQLTSGARLTLDKAQVTKVVTTRPEESEYDKIRPSYPDTADGQWALAQWCLQHKLSAQRTTHLKRVIELDANHAEARRALGYSRIEGKWMTQEEYMTQRGYKRYKGRWRSPQEIELLEGHRKSDVAQKEWAAKIERWRGWLGSDREQEARENLLAIKDPVAVTPLVRNLQNERLPAVYRLLLIEILAKIGTPEAIKALAACSLEDQIEEIRLTCLDNLEQKSNPEVVAHYVQFLRNRNNVMVNRAAVALGRLKAVSAVGPLIDALATTHKFQVNQGGGGPGSLSTTFGTGPGGSGAPGGGGLSVGGGPKIVHRRIENHAVLDALIAITGQNFAFNQQAWKFWFASQKKTQTVDARRD